MKSYLYPHVVFMNFMLKDEMYKNSLHILGRKKPKEVGSGFVARPAINLMGMRYISRLCLYIHDMVA